MRTLVADATGPVCGHTRDKVSFDYTTRGSVTETQSRLEHGRSVRYVAAAHELAVRLEAIHSDLNKVISAPRRSDK